MDNELLLARLKDTVNSSYITEKPKFFGFLSAEESVFVKNYLDNQNVNYSFYGGEHDAQRVMLCCYPEHIKTPCFPIKALTFDYRSVDVLRHRDFLGALMALGLKRETIGDILIEQGRAVVFLKNEIADYVIENLSTVGRVGVTIKKGYDLPLPETDALKENSVTVASCRLDCIVSAISSCSRSTAIDLIESGLVSVNSVVSQKITKTITNGDIVTVRRKGKFQIVSTDKKTKKDRILLVFKSY